MKKNCELTKFSKTFILSAAAALAFGAVAVGTTYALFTSEAGAEVTVASGKVSLKSEILDLKLFSLDEASGTSKKSKEMLSPTGAPPPLTEATLL